MTARESVPDRMTCTLRGSGAVIAGSNAARSFGEAEWLSDDELARLCIIIEELLANLYEHGGVTDDHEVELSLASEPGGIRVILLDPGTPFDPRAAPRSREGSDRGGGAGIDIVRAWAEFVDYSETAEGNRLELLLPVGTSR